MEGPKTHFLTDGQDRLNSFYEEAQSVKSDIIHLISIGGPSEYGFINDMKTPAIRYLGMTRDPEEAIQMAKKWEKRNKWRVFRVPQGKFFKYPHQPTDHPLDDVKPYLDRYIQEIQTSEVYDIQARREQERETKRQEALEKTLKMMQEEEKVVPQEEEKVVEKTTVGSCPTETRVDEDGVTHIFVNNMATSEIKFTPEEDEDRKRRRIKYKETKEWSIVDLVIEKYVVCTHVYLYPEYDPECEPSFIIRIEGACTTAEIAQDMATNFKDLYKDLFTVSVSLYSDWVPLISNAANVANRVIPDSDALNTASKKYYNPKGMKSVKDEKF